MEEGGGEEEEEEEERLGREPRSWVKIQLLAAASHWERRTTVRLLRLTLWEEGEGEEEEERWERLDPLGFYGPRDRCSALLKPYLHAYFRH